jgi:hypothetical protein
MAQYVLRMDSSREERGVGTRATDPHIFITMPAYRAERTVGQTVADIPQGLAAELILVDDASPDRTVERARDLGVRVFVHSRNRGYGGNQKSCYSIALEQQAEIVVLLHPDYQYDPKAVPLLIAPILAGDADMTFGSRFAGLGDPRSGGMPFYRYVGNRLTTLLENLMLRARFTEMHSGMRAYTRRSLLSLPFKGYSDDYLFDSQLLIDAVSSGQRVVEVPIPTRYTEESSSISLSRSLRYVGSSLLYCARKTRERGRRGSRWPVAMKSLRRGPQVGHGMPVSVTCPLCEGSIRFALSDVLVQCKNCGLISSKGQPTVRMRPPSMSLSRFAGSLLRLGRFWMPAQRIALIGTDAKRFALAARDRGWESSVREIEDDSADKFDVLFLSNIVADQPDPVEGLRSLRKSLSPDGILAITCSHMVDERVTSTTAAAHQHLFSRETLHATIRRSRLQIVDWLEWTEAPSPRGENQRWTLALCRTG